MKEEKTDTTNSDPTTDRQGHCRYNMLRTVTAEYDFYGISYKLYYEKC